MPETPITASSAIKMVRRLESLGLGFPRTAEGLEALRDSFMAITGTVERATWLVGRVLAGCPRCPTPIEMRRIFETKYPPADLSAMMEISKGKAE